MEGWAGMTVLVTGAQGFIGAWLAERLLEEGAEVVALMRDDHPDSRFRLEDIESRCHLAAGDLLDEHSLRRVIDEHDVRAVFHLAAQTIVGTASRSPLATLETNIRGTYNLLEACRSAPDRVERIVVASSDKAYGRHEILPYREDFALQPAYPYDVSKACADMLARSYATSYEMPVAVTRFANVYGEGDVNWSRVVPDTARALARGERPVVRSDGTPERDYLYVADAVDAYLAIAKSLDDPELRGRAWNAGWGVPVPVIDVVRRLISASGREVEPDIRGTGTPHGEIDRQWLDSSAIRSELGWEPRVELDEGLGRAWSWYEKRLA